MAEAGRWQAEEMPATSTSGTGEMVLWHHLLYIPGHGLLLIHREAASQANHHDHVLVIGDDTR